MDPKHVARPFPTPFGLIWSDLEHFCEMSIFRADYCFITSKIDEISFVLRAKGNGFTKIYHVTKNFISQICR